MAKTCGDVMSMKLRAVETVKAVFLKDETNSRDESSPVTWKRDLNQNNVSTSFCQTLQGKVKFDFGIVSNPAFGTVHVQGEFPRIRPRIPPQKLTLAEEENIETGLRNWAKKYFDFSENENFYGGMVECLSTFTPCSYPVPDTLLVLKRCYWAWIADNIFEVIILEKPISADAFEDGLNQILRVLQNDSTVVFREIPGFPGLRSLFLSCQDLMTELKEHSSHSLEVFSSFHFSMERFFGAMRVAYATPIDDKWSEESFRYWKEVCLAYYDIIPICFWISEGEKMPPKIQNSPSVRRLLDVLNSIAGHTNDLLGMMKDFEKNEGDNFIVFKVVHKKNPLEKVIENVCEIIKEELEQFIAIRNALLQTFDYDPIVVKYIDMIESALDGHNIFLSKSARHQAAGLVALID